MLELNKLHCGDALTILKTLPSGSVNCVVTSPPYWGLRDYGVDTYIINLCNVFDEVKRVLAEDGTCWVNIGDTYSGTGGKKDSLDPKYKEGRNGQYVAVNKKTSVPSKCLCQIPSRFAIEMCNRGWILRNEIIWHKPNCMPQSAKDRFTVDFEKIFFFVKNKKYYFEQQIEPYQSQPTAKNRIRNKASEKYKDTGLYSEGERDYYSQGGRNKRCVWSTSTKPYKEAHFATYPEELIAPMIKAGCPAGGVVLDPFGGAGTTAKVALQQHKNYVLGGVAGLKARLMSVITTNKLSVTEASKLLIGNGVERQERIAILTKLGYINTEKAQTISTMTHTGALLSKKLIAQGVGDEERMAILTKMGYIKVQSTQTLSTATLTTATKGHRDK